MMSGKTIIRNTSNGFDVSVIIPNYNSTDYLINCLSAIYSQQAKCSYEVIIVDSSDRNPEVEVKKKFPDVNFIHLEKRTYPGTARNVGVEYASGEILAFTDADCIICAGWIQKVYEAHESGKLIVAGSVGNGYKNSLVATAEYYNEMSEYSPFRKPGKTKYLPSGNFSIRKSIFNQVGGFRNHITGEDTQLSDDLRKIGFEIFFDPAILVNHFNRTKLSTYFYKQKEQGIGSYALRKNVQMPGSWLTRHRVFALFIPALRTVTIAKKVLKNDISQIFKFIAIYPIILWGLFYYSYGFWKAFDLHETNS